MKNNKFLAYGGGVLSLLIVFILGISVERDYAPTPLVSNGIQNAEQELTASLMIDYGNGRVQSFSTVPIDGNENVFEFLKQVLDTNNIELLYKDYGGDLGMFIESIGGVGKEPSSGKWWQYWTNGTYSQVGPSSEKINPRDVVEFKFIQGQQ